jgi:hypothetical protein
MNRALGNFRVIFWKKKSVKIIRLFPPFAESVMNELESRVRTDVAIK